MMTTHEQAPPPNFHTTSKGSVTERWHGVDNLDASVERRKQEPVGSELIAIDEALRIIKTVTSSDEIWILCDSRSAIQHLSDWTNVGGKTSLWKTPPTHPWYNRQAPGGALSIKADRVVQTTISRLASGHTRGLSFHLGQKIYENCTKCNLVLATPDHLLLCAGLDREDIYSSPLLVYDFLRTLGLMDLV
ncbi:RNase H domain-containing protein [Trichonephila clavipes]|nr:RNase H domain-containing protein [Trichonephila clavipes]